MNTNMIQMHEQKSIPNGPWDTLKNKVDFDLPNKDRTSFHSEYVDLLHHYFSSCVNNHRFSGFHSMHSYGASEMLDDLSDDDEYDHINHSNNNFEKELKECLIPLLLIGHYNKIDLAQLLMEQYQCSNYSKINQYISRSSLFDEMEANRNIDLAEKNKIKTILTNYLKCYTKYVEKPIPGNINKMPSTFKPFNDKIDNILSYYSKLNFCINQQNMIKTRPIQFDVYFVPPNATHDLDDLKVSGMIKSCPGNRFGADNGMEEIYHLLASQQAQKLMDPVNDNSRNKKLNLLIIRKNINNTNYDILYLFVDTLPYDLAQSNSCFKYNKLLWKLNTKRDVISNGNKLNVDSSKYSTNYDLFSISYHLHSDESNSNNSNNSYFYYNGFGSKITKQNIFSKWSFMFDSKHGNNEISYNISISNNLFFENNNNNVTQTINNDEEFGQYLFGLKYTFCSYQKTSRQTLTFPKDVLQNGLKQITEFDEQQQLYYYLTWSCKMQLIHKQYLHFTLKHRQPKEIAIFNTELTEIHSKETLYIVAVLNSRDNMNNNNNNHYRNNYNNKPKWKMNAFMTAKQIYNIYGVLNNDLPKGSRYITNYFRQDVAKHYAHISNNGIDKVRNWNHIEKIHSQQFRHNTPRFNDYDLNFAIKQSLDDIRNKYNDLQLIPILNVDTKRDLIRVDALIPIKIRNKWIAISYKKATRSYKAVVHQLYIDQDDIINKASLVDPKQFHALQWLKGNNYNRPSYNNNNSYNNHTQTTFPRYQKKNTAISNNNNNNPSRPKLRNEGSGDSTVSVQSNRSTSTIGSLSSFRSLDTENTFPSLTLKPSFSGQTVASATPVLANNDSGNSSYHNGTNNNGNNNNNNTTETIMVAQLRQQLNDALKMTQSVCRDSQLKDTIISQQEKQIQQLQQQILQQRIFFTTATLPNLSKINNPYNMNNMNNINNTIPSLPNLTNMIPSPVLNNNNSNNSNASNVVNNNNNDDNKLNNLNININNNNGNNTKQFKLNNTPSPIGSNGSNNNNNNNNIISAGNNMGFPNTMFPVQNNFNVLSVTNTMPTLPTTSLAFGATNSFQATTNNTPPASIHNTALPIPSYTIQPNSNSNSPQIPFLNSNFNGLNNNNPQY